MGANGHPTTSRDREVPEGDTKFPEFIIKTAWEGGAPPIIMDQAPEGSFVADSESWREFWTNSGRKAEAPETSWAKELIISGMIKVPTNRVVPDAGFSRAPTGGMDLQLRVDQT